MDSCKFTKNKKVVFFELFRDFDRLTELWAYFITARLLVMCLLFTVTYLSLWKQAIFIYLLEQQL